MNKHNLKAYLDFFKKNVLNDDRKKFDTLSRKSKNGHYCPLSWAIDFFGVEESDYQDDELQHHLFCRRVFGITLNSHEAYWLFFVNSLAEDGQKKGFVRRAEHALARF